MPAKKAWRRLGNFGAFSPYGLRQSPGEKKPASGGPQRVSEGVRNKENNPPKERAQPSSKRLLDPSSSPIPLVSRSLSLYPFTNINSHTPFCLSNAAPFEPESPPLHPTAQAASLGVNSPAGPKQYTVLDMSADVVFTEAYEVDSLEDGELVSANVEDLELELDSDSDSDSDLDPGRGEQQMHHPTISQAVSPSSHPYPLSHEERRHARAARIQVLAARRAPSLDDVERALHDLNHLLNPSRGKANLAKPKGGVGYKDCELSRFELERVRGVLTFLTTYRYHLQHSDDPDAAYWMTSSQETAERYFINKHASWARALRKWARQYIANRRLPSNPYGKWTRSLLTANEDLEQDLLLHLQSIGKYVRALDLVHYLARQDVMERWGLKKSISVTTAQWWMKALGYHWRLEPKGQYADGHERDDVVQYRQIIFLPAWTTLKCNMRDWTKDGEEDNPIPGRRNIAWFHDESIFYENDRRKRVWWPKSKSATPYKKGEGASLMVADVFSPDHGWLRSKDGVCSARVIFKPGANRDGYFTNEEVLTQAKSIMDILDEYSEDDHTVVYDNAKTHTKRPPDAPSARKTPKGIPRDGSNWGVEVTVLDASGSPKKVKVQMRGARFSDGREQPLYFPDDHPEHPGKFKGMAVILEERGYGDMSKVRAECKGFKCPPGVTGCCCRRMLFNEPDFMNVESLLEAAYRQRGYKVIFLPKYHCELNPIEQCWGYSKREYRQYPPATGEEALKQNVLKALDGVPLKSMRRFAIRSRRFIDAYRKGLNGKQAAWAGKKYRSHRVLPESLMEDLDSAKL